MSVDLDYIDGLSKKLIKLYKLHSISKTSIVSGDSKTPLDSSSFGKWLTSKSSEITGKISNPDNIVKFSLIWTNPDNTKLLFKTVCNICILNKGEARVQAKLESKGFGGITSVDMQDYIKVIDITNTKNAKKVVFDSKNNIVHPISVEAYEIYEKFMEKEDIAARTKFAKLTYSIDGKRMPYIEYDKDSEKELTHLNIHVRPRWMSEGIIDSPEMPKLFKEFMTHLFPNSYDRDFVYYWMFLMLKSKNDTVLLLHGLQGSGKGFFVTLCRELVGLHNYARVNADIFNSQFNSYLRDKVLAYLDEVAITKRSMGKFSATLNKIKDFANDEIAIEEKNKSVKGPEENTVNFIMANNEENINEISAKDRRFSTPKLSETMLDKGMEEASKLVRLLNTESDSFDKSAVRKERDQFLREVGSWIIANGKSIQKKHKFKPFKPLRNEWYWELVDRAMPDWFKIMLERVNNTIIEQDNDIITTKIGGYEIDLNLIKDLVNGDENSINIKTGMDKIKAHFKQYYYRGEIRIGELKSSRNGKGKSDILIPSEEYLEFMLGKDFRSGSIVEEEEDGSEF